MKPTDQTFNGRPVYYIGRDVNGNSRHCVHFTALLTDVERLDYANQFDEALRRGKTIGGRKYRQEFISFQSPASNLVRDLAELVGGK